MFGLILANLRSKTYVYHMKYNIVVIVLRNLLELALGLLITCLLKYVRTDLITTRGVCVCDYVCVYVSLCICVSISVCGCACMYVCVCMRVCTRVCVCALAHVCVLVILTVILTATFGHLVVFFMNWLP